MPRITTLALPALLAASLAVPASASAEANPYTPQQVCGPTYSVAQTQALRSNDGKVQLGQLTLMYSLTTGKSCGVTIKTRQVGTPTYTSVSVARYRKDMRDVKWKDDSGYFSYYAGPKYAEGTPACVRIGGYMKIPQGREGILIEPGFDGCPG